MSPIRIYRYPKHLSKNKHRDFPSGPVFKTLPSNAGGMGSIPGQGTKIPHAVGCGKTLKKN